MRATKTKPAFLSDFTFLTALSSVPFLLKQHPVRSFLLARFVLAMIGVSIGGGRRHSEIIGWVNGRMTRRPRPTPTVYFMAPFSIGGILLIAPLSIAIS